MLSRLRLALQSETAARWAATVEADETYIGGKARNMHAAKRKRVGCSAVAAWRARSPSWACWTGTARTAPAKFGSSCTAARAHRAARPRQHVEAGATVNTDAFHSYTGLIADYTHNVIDHAEAYVDGQIHTNGCENFWSLLKRAIKGTYVSVEPFHLFRYLDEQAFRFNNRKGTDAMRFALALKGIIGKRLTYTALTGSELPQTC